MCFRCTGSTLNIVCSHRPHTTAAQPYKALIVWNANSSIVHTKPLKVLIAIKMYARTGNFAILVSKEMHFIVDSNHLSPIFMVYKHKSYFFKAQPAGEACQLGCPKIVLGGMHVFIYCTPHWLSIHIRST